MARKSKDNAAVKIQYRITVDIFLAPGTAAATVPLLLDTTDNAEDAEYLQKLYKKCIRKKNLKFMLTSSTDGSNEFELPDVEVADKRVKIETEYVVKKDWN